MIRRWIAAAVLCALSCAALPARAQAPVPASTAVDPHDVIVKMLERNPSLASYTARVHVDLRMLNFPYLSPELDGTTYFKRPNNYEVVFDRVPGYAKGFSKLFNDIGDPLSWQKDQNIAYSGVQTWYGRPMIVLTLTKKIYSTILDHTSVFVDPTNYQLLQMEWHYRSGGTIVMRQWYREQGPYSVVSQQHVEIDIPHVRAVGDSKYGSYQTNVAVDDSVFTKP